MGSRRRKRKRSRRRPVPVGPRVAPAAAPPESDRRGGFDPAAAAAALRRHLSFADLCPAAAAERAEAIRRRLLETSRHVRTDDVVAIHPSDLAALLTAYDEAFFEGLLVAAAGETPVHCRLSKRMTRTGASTRSHFVLRSDGGRALDSFEIVVSSHLLFESFRGEGRAITVCGKECRHRLDALQRLFEHELIHLGEHLAWGDSDCAAERFGSIAWRLFGHTGHTHRLVSTAERAAVVHGVGVGTRVRFTYDGRVLSGVVNRVTKRATVLVPDRWGELFDDGHRYQRYYVPISRLQRIDDRVPAEAARSDDAIAEAPHRALPTQSIE